MISGYTGAFVFSLKSQFSSECLDFQRLERGFEVVGLVEQMYFEDGDYLTKYNEDYFFDCAWPLTTYFVAPVSELVLLESSYIKNCYRILETPMKSFEVEGNDGRSYSERKLLVWSGAIGGLEIPQAESGDVGAGWHSDGGVCEKLIEVLESCRRAAERKKCYLAVLINESTKEDYEDRIAAQREDSEWTSLGGGRNRISDLKDHGYVFTNYYL